MPAPVPTMSTDGWITAIPTKADRLLSYFFVSEASQSNAFAGQIASLPGIVQEFGHDADALRSAMERTLEAYLQPYFETVTITTHVELESTKVPGRMDVTVSIDVIEAGVSYSFGRLVEMLNSKILKIIDLNNNG